MVDFARFNWDEPTDAAPGTWRIDRLHGYARAGVGENLMHPEFTQKIHQLPEHRRQLVFRIRRQIAEGAYDTDEKLEQALDIMFDRVAAGDDDRRPAK